ncbi:MAG TPA: hypothetical protein VLE43_07140, partial [Candidatus Saccharimonadia bacterium]|nr:hypothetical protein [Candidatus Saccharimonadia bacterium]
MKRLLLILPAIAAMITTALLFAADDAKPAADAAKVKPLKILMVCGGCCHDYENQKRILAEGLSARANVE